MKANKFNKFIAISLVLALNCLPFLGCAKTENTQDDGDIVFNTVYGGKTVDVCNKNIRAYINNNNNEDYCARVLCSLLSDDGPGNCDFQSIEFEWKDKNRDKNTSYTVYIADNREFENAFETVTQYPGLFDAAYFMPGETYYYKVTGNVVGESIVDSFTVKDVPVRYISAGAMRNVRDLGGWTTTDGKTIQYGKLYRGGATDESISRMDERAREVFNYIGINHELDLRGGSPLVKNTWNFREDCFTNVIGKGYSSIFEKDFKSELQTIFALLADETKYPIYFHCSAGADRTGSLAFLVNGLCGVPYEQLRCDFELTSFSAWGLRARRTPIQDKNGVCSFGTIQESTGFCIFDMFKNMLVEYYGGNGTLTLAQTIEAYLLDFGVTQAQIDSVKSIMVKQ